MVHCTGVNLSPEQMLVTKVNLHFSEKYIKYLNQTWHISAPGNLVSECLIPKGTLNNLVLWVEIL